MSAAYLSVFMVLQYILVSDEIISFAERVSSAENFLQLFLLNGNCNLFNLIIFNFFFQRHTDKPDGTLKDGWKFEKSGNEFRFDFGNSES